MKQNTRIFVFITVIVATSFLFQTPNSLAVPSYSTRFGVDCSSCHNMWGALNGSGSTFRLSGYRAVFGNDLKPTEKDVELSNGELSMPGSFPISIITGVGYDYRADKRRASDGTRSTRTGSSIALMDASIFLSSSIGEHLSAFIEFPMLETRAWIFTPTGPGEANDTANKKNLQFSTEKIVFEVARFAWTNLLGDRFPRDSVNLLAGITHLPLAYSPGKIRLSVNQYPIYERRALDLIIGPVAEFHMDDLFRFSEPQMIVEINGMIVPGKAVTDAGKRNTLWFEYHLGIDNGSNAIADNNRQKDVYGRFVARWYNQTLGVFGYYSGDTYGDEIRDDAATAGFYNMGNQSANKLQRIGFDSTLSLKPFNIPLWLGNQFMINSESNPTGFGEEFNWMGGFHQLNLQVTKKEIAYVRYDYINGNSFDDRAAGGITAVNPREWDTVAGVQYLITQNVKFIGEYRHDRFEDKASTPNTAHLTSGGFTTRVMVGF